MRASGFEVLEAADVDQALATIRNFQVDVVCTDVQMPGTMDDIGLAQWLSVHRPDLPVAIISGSTKAFSEAMTICHPSLVVLKPASSASVIAPISRALQGQKRIGSGAA